MVLDDRKSCVDGIENCAVSVALKEMEAKEFRYQAAELIKKAENAEAIAKCFRNLGGSSASQAERVRRDRSGCR